LFKGARDFNVGDYVMIRIHSKQYPSGTAKKIAWTVQNFEKD